MSRRRNQTYLHTSREKIFDLFNMLIHSNDMLLYMLSEQVSGIFPTSERHTNLLVNICFQVKAVVVADLDMTDVKAVDELLYRVRIAPGRSGQSQEPEMRVFGHQKPDDLVIRIVTRGFMRFIYNMTT